MAFDLRRRISLALVGVSVAVASALAILLWTANLWMQRMMLDHFLARELGIYLEAQRDPIEIDAEGLGLRYFRPARAPSQPLPDELRSLGPGVYTNLRLGDQTYYVLVRDVTPGDRTYVAYNVSVFKLRERWLSEVLIAGILVTAAAAWLTGRQAIGRALRPLDSLVKRIGGLRPGQERQQLAPSADDGELRVIVDAVNGFMRELDRFLERERVFAAAASHELRTPLTAIRGAAEVLQAVPGIPRPVLARIEQSVAEAASDLDALLALSERREMPPAQPTELGRLLRQLAQSYEEQARWQQTALVWDIPSPVTLSLPPGVAGLIFTNLLRNALRACPAGEVRIHADAQGFSILDDGEGISAELMPTVFEPGTRGRQGGSGLGLYIAKTLADRAGWTLTLESRPGGPTLAAVVFARA